MSPQIVDCEDSSHFLISYSSFLQFFDWILPKLEVKSLSYLSILQWEVVLKCLLILWIVSLQVVFLFIISPGKKWAACTNLVVLVLHLVVLLLLHLLDWILPKLSYLSILQWEVCCVHQLPDCCWELMKSLFWSRNSIPTKAFLDKFSEVTLTMIQVFWSNIDNDSRIRELMKSLFWSRNWIPTKAFLEKQFYKIGRANRSQQMKDRYPSKRQIKET